MQLELFIEGLKKSGIKFKLQEPMKNHTSFKIGGNADVFVAVRDEKELSAVFQMANKHSVPVFILGKGSNLLVSDKGIEGAVVYLGGMNSVTVDRDEIVSDAGATLSSVCVKAKENCLTGLEFAYGIPGTVGGGLFMNAGAYGSEMKDVVEKADYITLKGEKGTITLEDMDLGYRTSAFKTAEKIITRVYFKLKKGDRESIEDRMNELINKRKSKQPLEYPSAGSTFKRPDGYFAGALIEQSGLKGEKVGGAEVSVKHAGFVINSENACCEDVKKLIKNIQQKVLKDSGVSLETEVIFVGRE